MEEAEPRIRGRDLVLALAVPCLLAIVASIAVVRYHRVDQASWQGIGFGMFATYEYSPARTVRIAATVDGETSPASVPAHLDDELGRVLVAPGDHHTVDFAEAVRSDLDADAVEVQVLGHDVRRGADGLTVSFKVLRTVTVRA